MPNCKEKLTSTCKEVLERKLGISYEKFIKLEPDIQQEIIEETRKNNQSFANEEDYFRLMIGDNRDTFFLKVKKGEKKMIGNGTNSYFVEVGLTEVESKNRQNTKITKMVEKEKIGPKAKIKSIFHRS